MDQINTQKLILKLKSNFNSENFRFLLSGKLATSLIIKYLIKENNINPKLSEILVPKLMGNGVYSNISQNIQTGTVFSEYTKILYLYHQFGIPQSEKVKEFAEEKRLILIEDCAHVLRASTENGKSKICNSNYNLFSFSKFTNCGPLGGLISTDKKFLDFVDKEIDKSSKLQSIIINLLYKLNKILKNDSLFLEKMNSMNYSLWNYPSKNLEKNIKIFKKKIEEDLIIRNNRFIFFKNNIKEKIYFDYFKYKDLICQKLPIIINDEKIMNNLIDKFKFYKFPYEILIYDSNRNFLKPNFMKIIVLDHSEKNSFFEKQTELLKELL